MDKSLRIGCLLLKEGKIKSAVLTKLRIAILYLPVLFAYVSSAQMSFDPAYDIPVRINNRSIENAWSGGLNYGQFSAIDLNLDGVKDLVIFDRTGNRILPFVNLNILDSVSYRYDVSYINYFPKLFTWALFEDFNCDGKVDIFAFNNSGIIAYRNTGSTELSFEKAHPGDHILTDFGGVIANLYVAGQNLPGIVDVDEDGDLDILTFGLFSSTVEYHQNQSMEMYGHCDSLIFELADNCWGNFQESAVSNSVDLGIVCKGGGAPASSSGGLRDAGNTILALDMDGDQDKDLIMGHLNFNSLVMITNGGDLSNANMVAQDDTFPSYDLPVALNEFPGAFFVDINNDQKRDLLVTPNRQSFAENFNAVWYYQNTGSDSTPVFDFIQKDAFQNQMIDVGEGAYPVLFDFNSDGLQDLVLANANYFNPQDLVSQIALYQNIGSQANPEFELLTDDLANLSTFMFENIYPTFGDIDDDGDQDMIIGELDGILHFFENSAAPGNDPVFTLMEPNYKGIDVGSYSTPQLFDLNGDQLLDLIIGDRTGKIAYYQNTGSASSADFSLVDPNLGDVEVANPFGLGFSVPQLWRDADDKLHLFVGSNRGSVFHYDNIEGNLNGPFDLVTDAAGGIMSGVRTAPAIWDYNQDGFEDLLLGNYSGGLRLFQGKLNTMVETIFESNIQLDVQISPNPVSNKLTLHSSVHRITEVLIFNLEGKLVKTATGQGKQHIEMNVSELIPGIYMLTCTVEQNESGCFKVMIY